RSDLYPLDKTPQSASAQLPILRIAMAERVGRGGRGRGRGSHGRHHHRRKDGGSARSANDAAAGARVNRPLSSNPRDMLAWKIGELVMAKTLSAAKNLESELETAQQIDPKLVDAVLSSTTTQAFPPGSLLAAACVHGHGSAAEVLLRYGANPDPYSPATATAGGVTSSTTPCTTTATIPPLALACYNGRTECVRLLVGLPASLQGGAAGMVGGRCAPRAPSPFFPPCARVDGGGNALIQACRGPDSKAAAELTELLVEVDVRLVGAVAEKGTGGGEGRTALHFAAERGYFGVVETLLKAINSLADTGKEVGKDGDSNMCAGDESDFKVKLLCMKSKDGRCPLQVRL
ncbi:unnamed protein product, partial [Discosporangium mesarthrocarpum]